MSNYSPAWPHSPITEIFPNIFFVTGTNKTNYNGIDLQHSRNMIIIRDGDKLSLINTVKLDDNGLSCLDDLGKVENVVRIGAFHGRDDAFYLDRYQAKLWALPGMKHDNNRSTDVELSPHGTIPFPDCSIFVFETAVFPEAILHISQEGGILVTCDSIKNWLKADPFFSPETGKLYKAQGLFGPATVSNVWKKACNVKSSDFERLDALTFRHILSAHGDPLLHNAHEALTKTIHHEFEIY